MTSCELYRLAQVLEEIAYSMSGDTDDVWIPSTVCPMPPGIPASAAPEVMEAVAALFQGLAASEIRIRARTAAQRVRQAAADRAVIEQASNEEVENRKIVER